MAKNKHTSSLIFCSVTSDLNYKCLFHVHLSMMWLVFSIQRFAYVFPSSTDENYHFPPFPLFGLPLKREKIRNICVSTSTIDTAILWQKFRWGQNLLSCGDTFAMQMKNPMQHFVIHCITLLCIMMVWWRQNWMCGCAWVN